jgi:glyoxylate reductase
MDRIYVTKTRPDDLVEPLRDAFEVSCWDGDGPMPRALLAEVVAAVDGLLCMVTESVDRALLANAPRLRVISQMAVGVDNIDVVECHRRGIKVGHTPGVLTETVADTAFALLSSIVRRIPEGEKTVRSGQWGPWDPFFLTGGDLYGATLGIVGMGRIGQAVARRASGFGMPILYTARSPRPEVSGDHVDIDSLLTDSDHVVICVALNEDTQGLIGGRELGLMRPTSYLVNVARGQVINTDALVAALSGGRIAGAALDVTDPEPLPADHPLLTFSNCLVVPHIGSASTRTRRAMAALAVSNLVAGLNGFDMPSALPTV